MEIGVFTEMINSFGLPVALIIAMGIFIFKLYKDSVKREEKLTAQIDESRAINAKAIETLSLYSERLGTIESDVKEIKDIVISQ